jgi:hypothetical protein
VNYSGANSQSWRVPESLSPGAPDSPVNYSGAPLDFSEGEKFQREVPFGYPLLSLLNQILGLFIG